ncbi:DUF2786 domain-containing protein [Corynebacterium confusum]|uniref:DUF2786 domain-containing protein n=1 Tax=uncultured Corynebacterium sp. TaxID=159447 RepID=UPI0025CE64F3|nr:DUF2786 domain-containing protein [uncultured Corynebacterium sp.]
MRFSYHRRLEQLADFLILVARAGWRPEDLIHICGPYTHQIVFYAAARIPAHVTSPALRHAWLTIGPPTDPTVPDKAIDQLFEDFKSLPSLPDWELLDPSQAAEAAMTSAQHKAAGKVDALLRKAESTEFLDEAETLIAKAQQLRQEYRLAEASAGAETETPCIAHRVHLHAPWVAYQAVLLSVIAAANSVTALLVDKRGLAVLVGAPDDCAHTVDLFANLNRQCDWHMRNGADAEMAKYFSQTASYRRSFRLSYAARISELLEEANHAGAASADGDADGDGLLPVLAERMAAARDALQQVYPHTSQSSLSMNNPLGAGAGASAAERSHLSGDSSGLAPHQRALSA